MKKLKLVIITCIVLLSPVLLTACQEDEVFDSALQNTVESTDEEDPEDTL